MRIQDESRLFIKADSSCGHAQQKKENVCQELIQLLNLGFCDYTINTIYIDTDVKDYIRAFNIDSKQ